MTTIFNFSLFVYFREFLRKDKRESTMNTAKKWSFPLKISPVNVTKSAVSCGLGHIDWRNPNPNIDAYIS